jgi:CRISPR-associated endonuclease/helicase Cas3
MPLYDNGITNLAAKMKYDSDSIEKMILLACALHDTGKLNVQWQSAMCKWQRISDPTAEQFVKGLPLAHTTYDPRRDWWRWKELNTHQGPHAAEGAYAILPMIIKGSQTVFDDNADSENMAIGIMAAIARHHGPRTSSLKPFRLIPEAKKVLSDAIGSVEVDLGDLDISDTPDQDTIDTFKNYLKIDQKANWQFLYWLFVRIIRLADQRATSKIGSL